MNRSSLNSRQSGALRPEEPQADIPRSTFDRSSGYKTTMDAGQLIPFFLDEVLPGDTFNLKTAGLCRLATPIFPVMDNMYMETFYFFVPTRLVWDNFQKMMGEQKNPTDSIDYQVPVINTTAGGIAEGTLADYMGIPTKVNNISFNALPIRAYNLIWNEWFRDQNLQTSIDISTGNGPDDPAAAYYPLRRGKRHDYFTSSLPWPQKGPSVMIPSATSSLAPITGIGITNSNPAMSTNQVMRETGNLSGTVTYPNASVSTYVKMTSSAQASARPEIYANLADINTGTINQLRQAFQIQRMYERDARGGTRYTEIIRSHFGVTSPDARLQRPEYLGGGHTPININPIYATAETSDAVIGRLSGVGIASFGNHGFTKSFTEHGYIIGLVNVRADLTYWQGKNRLWKRSKKLDFYWPALSHIGEQGVANDEIFATSTPATNDAIFGYQERYAEYRYKPSTVTAQMRPNAAASLEAWHLAQEFSALPVLNGAFIQDNPPIDRVIAVPSEPQFICDFHHKLTCTRPMPLFGIPGYADHF